MWESSTLTIIAATFLLAGSVKGVIGLGLPTVSLALLTVAIDLPTSMALLLVPSFTTNLWQALVGRSGKEIAGRIWPFLLMAGAMVWVGARALTRVDVSLLSSMLGMLLVVYALVSLVGYRLIVTRRQEVWVGPLIGAINGVLTGMTGSFVVPGVLFLQSIGLSRDQLVQAMGMLFTVSTLALALALQGNNLLTLQLGVISGLAVVPSILGMMIGQRVRQKLDELTFRRIFFISILLLGMFLIGGSN